MQWLRYLNESPVVWDSRWKNRIGSGLGASRPRLCTHSSTKCMPGGRWPAGRSVGEASADHLQPVALLSAHPYIAAGRTQVDWPWRSGTAQTADIGLATLADSHLRPQH